MKFWRLCEQGWPSVRWNVAFQCASVSDCKESLWIGINKENRKWELDFRCVTANSQSYWDLVNTAHKRFVSDLISINWRAWRNIIVIWPKKKQQDFFIGSIYLSLMLWSAWWTLIFLQHYLHLEGSALLSMHRHDSQNKWSCHLWYNTALTYKSFHVCLVRGNFVHKNQEHIYNTYMDVLF